MPSSRPRVSVVIPSHNAAPFLEECVGSVVAQTYASLEVIIVDDASTDDSLAVARRLAETHAQRPITVIEEHARRSSITRNTGIAKARGEYILNLDADDLIDPRFVELTVAALDAHPEAGVAYGTWKVFGERSGTVAPKPWDFGQLVRGNYIAANSLFRRSAWEAVGGFATDLRYEDWDLWVRFGEAGYTGVPVAEAVFYYRTRSVGQNVQNAPRNTRIRAEFIYRRPHLYNTDERAWARRVREDAGEPAGLAPAGAAPLPPTTLAHRPEAELATPRRTLAFIALPDGDPNPSGLLTELAAGGIQARTLTPSDTGGTDSVKRAEELAARDGADWVLLLNPGETAASPWLDLDLGEAISFIDSLGYDAVVGERPDGHPGRRVAWKLAVPSHTVCPVPLVLAPAGQPVTDGERLTLLARASRDLLLSAAVRGGPAVGMPEPEALGRWSARALGLDRPVPTNLMQAALTAVSSDADLSGLDPRELAIMLAAARLTEAEVRVRNRPEAVSRARRDEIQDAILAACADADETRLDVRGFATAVHADEVANSPALVAEYADAFSADDDATLVIYDFDDDPAALGKRLGPIVAESGLDVPDAPDVLALSAPPGAEWLLTARLDALLTRRVPTGSLADLPRFDGGGLPGLRELAQRRWATVAP